MRMFSLFPLFLFSLTAFSGPGSTGFGLAETIGDIADIMARRHSIDRCDFVEDLEQESSGWTYFFHLRNNRAFATMEKFKFKPSFDIDDLDGIKIQKDVEIKLKVTLRNFLKLVGCDESEKPLRSQSESPI